MMSSLHTLVSMLARAAAGGAERKAFLKEVVTTPDASMVIGEPSVLQALQPCSNHRPSWPRSPQLWCQAQVLSGPGRFL